MTTLIGLVIIGTAAGFLATRLMRIDTDIPTTIAIGVGGALIGGLVLRALLAFLGVAAGVLGAVVGALVLIWAWQQFGPKP